MKKEFKIKKYNFNKLFLFFIFILVYIISFLFSPYYTEGDQVPYTNAYNAVKGEDLISGFIAYQVSISSQEPIHYIIDWVFSNLNISKNVVMSFSNSLLAISIAYLMIILNVSYSLIIITIFSNFYILVLYFAAERLKFGFLFLTISLIYNKSIFKKIFYLIMAIASHTQILIIVFAKVFANTIIKILIFLKNFKFKGKFKNILLIIIFVYPLFYLYDHILSKFITYSGNASSNGLLQNIWQTIIFSIIGIFYAKNKNEAILMFLFILICSSILGPERITMMSYFLFFYYALMNNRGKNIAIYITTFYFSMKSIFFIQRIIENGHGF